MLKRLRKLFSKEKSMPEKREFTASQMMTDDPVAAEVMARALNTGETVFATRDEEGNVTYH